MKRVKNSEYGPLPFEWNIEEIQNIADNEVANSFIDGDWIESKYLEEEGIRLIQTGNIGLGSFKEKKVKKFISPESYEELKCKEVKENDILICRLADPIGRACIVPNLGTKNITSVDIVILRPDGKKYDTQFINYLLNSNKTLAKVQSFSSGTTRQRISRKNLGSVRIPVPPLDEQQKIASILSSVDEAIEKTEQIIKQTETVKKGIARSIFRHKSGNKLMKLGDITDIKTGGTPSRSKEEYWVNGKIKWMASGDIHQGYVHEVPGRITELGLSNSNTRMLPIDTVMIALNGQGKTRGTVAILQTELTCNQSLAGLLPNSTLDSYYLYYNLQARYNEIRNYTGEGTRTGLNLRILKNIEISVPSVEKQSETVEILQSIDKKIQIENAQKQTLLEVKKGLMQQLLTGKVRVSVCH